MIEKKPEENSEEAPKEAPTEEPKETPEEQPKLETKELTEEQPIEQPSSVPVPVLGSPAKKQEPAKIESGKPASFPRGVQDIIQTAKGHATNAGQWIQSHPLHAGLIGTGVAIGSLMAGWLIFRAIKGGKGKSGKSRRNHARSIDVTDAVLAEFPASSLEKRAILDEIDWNDEEFLEFLNLLPGVEDILEANVE